MMVAADLGTPVDKGTATEESKPFFPLPTDLDSAVSAYQKVLADAGCSLHRDAIDTRLIDEVRSLGKRGTITHDPATLGGFGVLRGGTSPLDSDHDGMSYDWERKHGLNPNDPMDTISDFDHTGYTNIEKYVNSLTGKGER